MNIIKNQKKRENQEKFGKTEIMGRNKQQWGETGRNRRKPPRNKQE